MTKISSFLLLCLFFVHSALGQAGIDSSIRRTDSTGAPHPKTQKKSAIQPTAVVDSLVHTKDSVVIGTDSIKTLSVVPTIPTGVLVMRKVLSHNPWFNFSGTALLLPVEEHKPNSREGLFYLLLGLLFYFSLVKVFFAKYLNNLASLFLRASMRQQQLREQLLQTPLPSLLLNILFAITSGLYICFLTRYYGVFPEINFWLFFIDCCILVGVLYSVKFLVLKVTGWIFNISQATDTYIFIVYMVNKVLGILLLPFLIVLFLSTPPIQQVTVVISLFLIVFLFLYRFLAAYPSIRNEIKISIFYFFLYLCAFEIAPLLLIYKVLLTYLEKGT